MVEEEEEEEKENSDVESGEHAEDSPLKRRQTYAAEFEEEDLNSSEPNINTVKKPREYPRPRKFFFSSINIS